MLGFWVESDRDGYRFKDDAFDIMTARFNDTITDNNLKRDGHQIIRASKVKLDGSVSSETNLARCTEAVPVVKVGGDRATEIDTLLTKCTQIDPNEKVYNRTWLAQQLSVKSSDLSNALRPDAPAKSMNGLADRAVRLVRVKYRNLELNNK